ncbi:maltotransferase domain-containing protein [Homoserinimonas sp. OAct 916]|uniref:maltotransferase domain-containing protein n=1 Tax=Homoserinimonas sp. OAct 916 TaxID=2211450 RepID=UPI000DBE88DD|nr:maltotransferase domain-containing protein [Homoserinimonas sp. OAct 916]
MPSPAPTPPVARPVRLGRIPILDLTPRVDDGAWPATAFAGEAVPFRATAFREGHDLIGVTLLLTDPQGGQSEHPMVSIEPGLDRWQATRALDVTGKWTFRVRAYADLFNTWLHDAIIKIEAEVDVDLMFQIGYGLLAGAAKDTARPAAERTLLRATAALLADPDRRGGWLDAVAEPRLLAGLQVRPISALETESESHVVIVERERAGRGAWYEFFPRSVGAVREPDGSWKSGTFRTAATRLPEIAAMGFDVVYLPPIHPIGRAFRKGPNNSLNAGENDPGSPWAIGSAEGGHDSIHPDLGSEKDFLFFSKKAAQHGLEIALDLALQASPDHPWVTAHPEWFTTLPDGSIAYAENPPKKYQDIYPINFDNDPEGIYAEVLRVVTHWMNLGVRIFRVDNPHTKPVAFWERLLAEVATIDPGIVFLAEAFTRPALLTTLAKVGFQQSYTYFTWRNTKEELEEFLTDLAEVTADYLRPNLFVNTPDILTEFLQFGGPPAYKIRAALAATAAPIWGVYSGYELYENVARPGSEENIDNEKYEFRPRDFAAAEAEGRSLAPYIRLLNDLRREHPSLGQLRNLHLHSSHDDFVLVYSKFLPAELSPSGRADAVIVVANLDPYAVRETTIQLDLTALGLPHDASFQVTDAATGARWLWGSENYVRLDPHTEPVHLLRVDLNVNQPETGLRANDSTSATAARRH